MYTLVPESVVVASVEVMAVPAELRKREIKLGKDTICIYSLSQWIIFKYSDTA